MLISISLKKAIESNFLCNIVRLFSVMMTDISSVLLCTINHIHVKQLYITQSGITLELEAGDSDPTLLNMGMVSNRILVALQGLAHYKLEGTHTNKDGKFIYENRPDIDLSLSNLIFYIEEQGSTKITIGDLHITKEQFRRLGTPIRTSEEIIRMRTIVKRFTECKTMLLKKADFVGDSLWELIDEKIYYMTMKDTNFLTKIREGKMKLWAGMRMSCKISTTYTTEKNYPFKLLRVKYEVTEVMDVIKPLTQLKMDIKDENHRLRSSSNNVRLCSN